MEKPSNYQMKSLIYKNGTSVFAVITSFATIAGTIYAASQFDETYAIVVLSSGIAASALFFTLGAIASRLSAILYYLFIRANPQGETEDTAQTSKDGFTEHE